MLSSRDQLGLETKFNVLVLVLIAVGLVLVLAGMLSSRDQLGLETKFNVLVLVLIAVGPFSFSFSNKLFSFSRILVSCSRNSAMPKVLNVVNIDNVCSLQSYY